MSDLYGPASGLTWTGVAGGTPAGPLTAKYIQKYSYSGIKQEVQMFGMGNARVETPFGGKKTATLGVDITDMSTFADFQEGQIVSNLALSISAAYDSGGSSVSASGCTVTFSTAYVSEVGELGSDSNSGAPVVGTVMFTLCRQASADTDPTVTVA